MNRFLRFHYFDELLNSFVVTKSTLGHGTVGLWRYILLVGRGVVLVGILASTKDSRRGKTSASSNCGLFLRSLLIKRETCGHIECCMLFRCVECI